jgi:hypothetical protein
VGKLIVLWLAAVVVVGIATIDTVSILFTSFRASDIASNAASEAANAYEASGNRAKACEAAQLSVELEDPGARITANGCVVDERTGEVTVTVRKTATTLIAGRLSFTKRFARPEATETNGPTVL